MPHHLVIKVDIQIGFPAVNHMPVFAILGQSVFIVSTDHFLVLMYLPLAFLADR